MKVWLQEKGAEPCGPFQLRGLLRPCHLPSLPCRLCPCLCFPKSVASVLCHLGPLGLSLPLLPSQPIFAALPLSSALFVHLSSSSPFLFVFLAFSLLPRLGFPSDERVPGKEGSLRPWKSPADPAPSCDLPACQSPPPTPDGLPSPVLQPTALAHGPPRSFPPENGLTLLRPPLAG